MKPRTCANAFLATLALLVVCPGGIASTYQNDDDAAIDAYIARQAQRERGQEYREARKVVVGDLTHDNVPETVVLYTIEGQRGTNRHTQYLAVFSRQNGQLKPITHAAMGSKSVGGVKLRSVEDESIVLDTLSYAAKDAECCPSIPGSTRYVLSGRTLREQKKGASKGGRASARGGTGTFQRSFSFRDFRGCKHCGWGIRAAMLRNVLNSGVTPSAAERQAVIDEFAGAATSAEVAARGRALRLVAENATLQQPEFNRAFVLMQYLGYLRRNPNDPQDFDLFRL